VQGNRIGTDITGTLPLPNARGGVSVGTHNLIGGSASGAGNLISGNGSFNLSICGGGYSYNYVLGNYIGPDVTGLQALPGALGAIGVFLCADDNFIGGSAPGEGNLISANTTGIDIRSHRNTVKGNRIGTDASGTLPLGNEVGIYLADFAQDNVIGGPEPGAGNVIGDCRSGGYGGIWLNGPNVKGTVIQGNWIGVDRTGSIPLPNHGWGVVVSGNTDTIVGGVNPGEGNVIAHSENAGVWVSADDFYGVGLRNPIRGNSIYANGWNTDPSLLWPGIDLGGWGVTPNDAGDTDEGAHRLQNYPVLDSASSAASETHVSGSLESIPNTVFVIDFYANTACDESGFGEGERYLGAVSVTTDNSGQASFHAVLPAAVSTAEVITATATDPEGNTSEFSPCSPPIVSVDSDGDGVPDDLDHCADSDLASVIVIDGCDTGVPNVITERGCTLADRLAQCAEGVGNHTQYVARVTLVALLFERAGLITQAQAAALIRCAARADIP
jgi:titin